MRILHLLASPVFSGPAENVALLALAQQRLGHQVTVAVDGKRPGLDFEEPIRPRLAALNLLDAGDLELSVKSSPIAMLRDVLRLRRRAVDVVHTHFSHDHVLAHFGVPRGTTLVRSLHAPRSLRGWLPRADAWTVPSPALLERISHRHRAVLPPLVGDSFGPPPHRQVLRAELGVLGEPMVGMASTFQPSRRHEVGVDAFALLQRERPGARLVLIGDGQLEGAIRAQVERLGLSRKVTFAGYQSGPSFVRWLQALDEVWVLGLGNDYSGRLAVQARACGVRVLAVNEGALGQWADAVFEEPTPQAVLRASLGGHRTQPAPPSNEAIARAILDLYAAAWSR